METPQKFLASKPKEPKVYHRPGKCPIHKTTKLKKDSHECCDCCCGGGCEPNYSCPKCEAIYNKKYAIWFRKFGHLVAVGEGLEVKNGRLMKVGHGLRYMQFYHGGKPLKIGTWCKVGNDGFLKRSTKNNYPQMLVIS